MAYTTTHEAGDVTVYGAGIRDGATRVGLQLDSNTGQMIRIDMSWEEARKLAETLLAYCPAGTTIR